MAAVLSAHDDHVPEDDGARADDSAFTPGDVGLQEEYAFYCRAVVSDEARKLYAKVRRTRYALQGKFNKPYNLRPGWEKRKTVVDAKLLQQRLDENKMLQRLRRIQAIPFRERAERARLAIEKKELPPVLAEIEGLQEQITAMTDILVDLDRKMRRLQQQADWIRCKASTVAIPTDIEIKRQIDSQIGRLRRGVEAQGVALEHLALRKQHNYWGNIQKQHSAYTRIKKKPWTRRNKRKTDESGQTDSTAQAGTGADAEDND